MNSGGNFFPSFVQAQSVEKLYSVVQEKLSHGQPAEKITELTLLWQKVISSNDSVTAISCSQALLKLIKSGNIKLDDAIDTVVNFAVSAKNARWLVHFAVKLLILQFNNNVESCENSVSQIWRSPYKLHYHTHPFIFILNSCSRAWTFIVLELQSLFKECVPRTASLSSLFPSHALYIFKPFLLYILLNPSVDSPFMVYKSSLLSVLTKNLPVAANDSYLCDVHTSAASTQFWTDILCHIHVADFTGQFYNQILDQISSLSHASLNLIDKEFISRFIFSVLSSCYSMNQSPSVGSVACILYSVLRIVPDVEHVGVLAIGLSNLICRASSEALLYLLQCVVELLKFSNWLSYPKPIMLACLHAQQAAVLQLLLYKQCLGFCDLSPFLYSALNSLQTASANLINKEGNKGYTVKNDELIFHDSWLFDLGMLLRSFQPYQENLLLYGSQYILLLNSSENMALNVGMLFCGAIISNTMVDEISAEEQTQFLNVLLNIVASFPQLALPILPTILYAIKNEFDPIKHKNLCLSLPDLAVDNNSMPFIIGAIQAMSQVSTLRSFAIKLMLNLWKKQERCFPHLQKILSQTIVLNLKIKTEIVTVTSVTLRDLCKSQSVKYSSEILAIIAVMLKKELLPAQAVLLLDGIYNLLLKEIISIQSLWTDLMETHTSYHCDAVTKAILKIFSLVPEFSVDLQSFLQFKSDVLSWVWTLLDNSSASIKGAALVCLAHFKLEDFILKYVPIALRPTLPEEMSEEEFLLQPIPGELLVQMVSSVFSPAQVQYFCCSFLSQELQNMPRDIKDRAFRAQKQAIRGNLFTDFSTFILRMHERNKQPNLKGHFATSVLMCYSPVFEDSPKSLVSSGREALQLLQVLLCEVTVDAKNWKGLLWIVQGWKHFVLLCLQIMVKGRIAELNLQLKQKDCDRDDVQYKLDTAGFWCRDKVTDLLKSSSKGTPTMQGNSFLALSSLICALKLITSAQESNSETRKADKDASGCLSHNHWIGIASDTILTAADSKYKSVGRLFSWCQYKAVSRAGRLTTSKFGEICALQALRVLIPALMPHDMDRISAVLSMLVKRVPLCYMVEEARQSENETPMMTLHLNLTLGSISADLLKGKVHESSNSSLRKKIEMSLSTLISNASNCLKSCKNDEDEDDYSSDEDTDDMVSSLLGVGMILPAIFTYDKSVLKEDAIRVFNSLLQYTDSLEDKSGTFLEAFYFSFVVACIAGKASKSITCDVVSDVLIKLHKQFLDNRNIAVSVAMSHLCYELSVTGEKHASELFKALLDKFLHDASNERLPTRQKLISLNGLVALIGSESVFAGCISELTQETESSIRKVIKILKQYIQQGKDVGITSNSIMLLGRLYLALHSSNSRQSSSMPQSFSYLPETSLLRSVYSAVLNLSKVDPNSVQSVKTFAMSLSDAANKAIKPLPPVDLLIPLSKLFQLQLNEVEQSACIRLALSQVSENETAAVFLDGCIEPSKFQSLHLQSQCLLLKSLHVLTQHLSSASILSFLLSMQSVFFTDKQPVFRYSFLQGILLTLRLSSLPKDIPAFLFSFANKLIREYKFSFSDSQLHEHWKIVADIAAEDPNNQIISALVSSKELCIKILCIKCHLICQGFQPIRWMHDVLELCSNSESSEIQSQSLWIVFLSLRKRTPATKSSVLLAWLQELVAILQKLFNDNSSDLFWLKIFSVCVMILANRGSLKNLKKDKDCLNMGFGVNSKDQVLFLWNNCLTLLPQMLTLLLSQQNITDSFSQHVIELLIHLYTHAFKESTVIRYCLLQVFHSPPTLKTFHLTSTWANIASMLFLS